MIGTLTGGTDLPTAHRYAQDCPLPLTARACHPRRASRVHQRCLVRLLAEPMSSLFLLVIHATPLRSWRTAMQCAPGGFCLPWRCPLDLFLDLIPFDFWPPLRQWPNTEWVTFWIRLFAGISCWLPGSFSLATLTEISLASIWSSPGLGLLPADRIFIWDMEPPWIP